MAFAGTHIALLWDMENVRPSNETSFSSAQTLLDLFQHHFPGTSIHFTAFGDSEQFTFEQIDHLLKGGGYFTDIPGRQGQGLRRRLVLQGQGQGPQGQGQGPQGQRQADSEADRHLINKMFT
ncbi:hypothetical protein Tco_0254167, partial [Tanacetum coccineum]